MPTLRRRLLKLVKWTSLTAAAMLAALWIVSGWWRPEYMSGQRPFLQVVSNSEVIALVYVPDKYPHDNMPRGWSMERSSAGGPQLSFRTRLMHTPDIFVLHMPHWLPLTIALGLTLATSRLDAHTRRRPPIACPACHYNRQGLNPKAPCPECGKPANL